MGNYYLECVENYRRVEETIAEKAIQSGRTPQDIKLITVTKTVEAGAIAAVIEAGAARIGENRVQEILNKKEALAHLMKETHMIGHLQSNKAKYLPGNVDMIQSIDSVKLAQNVSKEFAKQNMAAKVLIEVNIGRESSKSGVSPELLEELFYSINELPGIKVEGLMTIPPICTELEARRYFEQMYKLFIDIQSKNIDNIHAKTLSMGMTGDYQSAILEGATMVRVGTGIFGRRLYK